MCGPPRDAPMATAASVAVRSVGRQRSGQLRWPAAVTARSGRSAIAPALAERSCRFAPGVLRHPRAGAALPLPAPAALRLVCSAVAAALAPRSFHFAPGVLRRPRDGAALPLPAPASFRLVCSAVGFAMTPRSPRVRRPPCAWCVAPVLATRRTYPLHWLFQLPRSGGAADEGGRMGEGGASDGRGG